MNIIHSTRTITRVLGISAAVLSASGFSLVSAHSANVSGSNGTTGPSSVNTNTHHIVNNDTTRLSFMGTSTNNIFGTANSGHNSLHNNTTAGSLLGGNISLGGTYSNDINTGTMDAAAAVSLGNDTSGDLSNQLTGPNSSNRNTLNVRNTTNSTITQTARISNNVRLNTNTGYNVASNNTTVGDVASGSTTVSMNFDNTANQGNESSVVSTADHSFTGSMSNDTTGPNSSNTNTTSVTNTTKQTVNKMATINNNFCITANSGENSVSGNTTVGDVSSGDITIDLSATNAAN
jgi:hypothetical protein